MGLFDIVKKKKSQSEMALEASKRFLAPEPSQEVENMPYAPSEQPTSAQEDIMERLKNIDPSSMDPRKSFLDPNISPPPQPTEQISDSQHIEHINAPKPPTNMLSQPPLPSHDEVRERIEGSMHPREKNDEILYELRTIKTQNDLIIDMLRQIQRKLNM